MNINQSNLPEEIEKKEFLYIWIDILGFRNKLSTEKEEVYNKLFDIKKSFKKHFEKLKLETIVSISDGLLLVWDIKGNKLDEVFINLAKLQIDFILKYKYVIRGAISIGTISNSLYNLYISNENNKEEKKDIFLISNGLVKAYEMESKEIKWPIIAIDYETIEKLREIKRINNSEFFGLQKINGNNEKMYLYMIDFLEYLDEDKQMEYENFLLTELNAHQNNRKIFEKYYWLLEYYKKKTNNNVFEKFIEFYDGVLI